MRVRSQRSSSSSRKATRKATERVPDLFHPSIGCFRTRSGTPEVQGASVTLICPTRRTLRPCRVGDKKEKGDSGVDSREEQKLRKDNFCKSPDGACPKGLGSRLGSPMRWATQPRRVWAGTAIPARQGKIKNEKGEFTKNEG